VDSSVGINAAVIVEFRSAVNYFTVGEAWFSYSDLFVGARAELERRIPKTGITPNGFARHCILGHRYPMMKKFLFLILGI
jgi:hypothetical protein